MGESSAKLFSACGKVILLGEHAVVHGENALAASIGRSAEASAAWADGESGALHLSDGRDTWPVDVGSELDQAFRALLAALAVDRPVSVHAHVRIPTRAGLGSSAAIGVAIARAIAGLQERAADLSRDTLAATAWERVFHGNPSGVDVAVAVHGGCLSFSRRDGATPVPIASVLSLCLVQSGPRASTRAMVDAATAYLRAQPDGGAAILSAVRDAVGAGTSAVERGDDTGLGNAMNANQRVLRQWQLSTPAIDTLCDAARMAGALGAKLTGAGGGGSVIALAPGRERNVLDAWRGLGFEGMVVEAGVAG